MDGIVGAIGLNQTIRMHETVTTFSSYQDLRLMSIRTR